MARYKIKIAAEVTALQWTGDNHIELHDFLPSSDFFFDYGNLIPGGLVLCNTGGVPIGFYILLSKCNKKPTMMSEEKFRELYGKDESQCAVLEEIRVRSEKINSLLEENKEAYLSLTVTNEVEL